ncbi:MAG TPA: SDR family oxidoreductase [Elusimicrobiota bacterium]|nr:SDR family oxidoreductase [Elusimicrobiota bacterium]
MTGMDGQLFSCRGRVAVVSGGEGLIGREIVRGLVSLGARVTSADSRPPRSPAGRSTVKLDITRQSSIRSAFEKVRKREGRLDILVNCAYPRTKDWGTPSGEKRAESWKKNVDAHLGGYFFSSQIAAEMMTESGGGSIINIASIYGVVGPDFGIYEKTSMTTPAAYAAIKGGVIAFTRYLATRYGKKGVRVNAVSPGGVADGQSPAFVKQYVRRTPLGRMADPGDIVGAVAYLASDASSYVTGINLLVDGGWTAW